MRRRTLAEMEMRDDDARRRCELDERLSRLHRLERRKPDTAGGWVLLQRPKEREEIGAALFPPVREVDTDQDDLGHARVAHSPDLALDLLRRSAPLRAPKRRDDAEGATPLAAVLDLEESARSLLARERRREDVRPADRRGSDDLPGQKPGLALGEEAFQLGEPGGRHDEIDLGPPGERLSVSLGQAAGDDECRPRVGSPEAAEEPALVPLGAVGHRAAVKDDDVGGFGRRRTLRRRSARQALRLDATHLAAERHDRDSPTSVRAVSVRRSVR
jgi:hypothetical protein